MKYNDLISKLTKYMNVGVLTYEEQSELIAILSEICDKQNDMLMQMKNMFETISKKEE